MGEGERRDMKTVTGTKMKGVRMHLEWNNRRIVAEWLVDVFPKKATTS